MTRLLIDLGNSRLKWAWADGMAFSRGGALDHADPDFAEHLKAAWSGAPDPQGIWLAAVAAAPVVARVESAIAARWSSPTVIQATSPAQGGGVRSAYAEPERLGVDRFLAMVGAHARASGAALVAGCGTAIALDLVDADGSHRGGLIAPAPELMRDSVLGRTGRVAWQRTGRVVAFGHNTEDGLESGCWHAAAALVERAHAQATRELGAAPALYLHGGCAAALAALLGIETIAAPDLVLEGLHRLASGHQ